MHRFTRVLLGASLASALLLLTACTPGPSESAPPGSTAGGAVPPGVTVSSDPAPSASGQPVSMRVDAVRRLGQQIRLGLTMAVGDSSWPVRVAWPKFNITTNDGVSLQVKDRADRTIAPNSTATMAVEGRLPETSPTSVTVKWEDVSMTVPLPSADGTTVWRPAALRQVGLAAPVLSNGLHGAVLDTIRTAGMVTEVTFHGWNGALYRTGICGFGFNRSSCKLVEPDGTVHQLLAGASEEHPAYGRIAGTLRFLGELKPDTKTLQVYLAGHNNFDPVEVELPTHQDSPAEAIAGSLVRDPVILNPARKLTHKRSGAKLTIDRVDVLDDRVQVHAKLKGGKSAFELRYPKLVDPSAREYPSVESAAGLLTLKAKGTMDVTFVFLGAVPADVTSLEFSVGASWDSPLRTKLAIPAADPNPPAPEATLGQLEQPAPEPIAVPELAPESPVPSGSPTPSPAASVGALDVVTGPLSTDVELGPVRTFVKGASTGANTAEDPTAAEKAERTLEEMGAKRTPDGWTLTLPETVLFDYNSADLRPDANATLTRVAELLNHFNKAKIGVNGHTDNSGAADYNKDLSTRRANAVADALAGGGVAKGRMTITGLGETKPIASNGSDAGKQKNRRVEIVLRQAN
ncbi:MAG: OmpA family protein [Micropruina sp.]|uniref:OmpA family protein n=1 Tax=Micropruina sp. TaxID=2737536 RepID=UPI0039E72B5C